ncbi:unnamed protein product, partial [Prorocentrum cordatum]
DIPKLGAAWSRSGRAPARTGDSGSQASGQTLGASPEEVQAAFSLVAAVTKARNDEELRRAAELDAVFGRARGVPGERGAPPAAAAAPPAAAAQLADAEGVAEAASQPLGAIEVEESAPSPPRRQGKRARIASSESPPPAQRSPDSRCFLDDADEDRFQVARVGEQTINAVKTHLDKMEESFLCEGNQMFERAQHCLHNTETMFMKLSDQKPDNCDELVKIMHEQKVARDKAKKEAGEGEPEDQRSEQQQADDNLDEYMDALKQNNFHFTLEGGSIMAGRWRRAKEADEQLRKDYDALKTARRSVKAAFRAKFAKKEYDEHIEERRYTEKLETIDTNKGEYLPLQRIAHKEGGGREGLRAAVNHCLRCLQMCDKWVWYDEWTRRIKFLYFVRGLSENFTRAWSMHQTWRSKRMLRDTASSGP